MIILKYTFIFSLLFQLSSNVNATTFLEHEDAKVINEHSYKANLSTTYFVTTSYYDNSGLSKPAQNGSDFKMLDTDFGLSYGLLPNTEASFNAKLRSNSSSIVSDTVSNSASKTGFESGEISFKYSFMPIQNFHFALGAHYLQTFYTNKVYTTTQSIPTDEIILGDDGFEYGIDLYATYLYKLLKWNFKLGFNSPPNNLSSELVYKIESLYKMNKFEFYLGMEGIKSLNNDRYANTPSNKPILSTGQTHLFNSINREKTAAFLGGSFFINNYALNAKVETVLAGKSTDKGHTISFGVTFVIPEKKKQVSPILTSFNNPTTEDNEVLQTIPDASIVKLSPKGLFAVIDRGFIDNIETETTFQIYQKAINGKKYFIANGKVIRVGPNWSILKISEKEKLTNLRVGFFARKL
ncbi:MAG: hypothetical protein KBD76_02630 [Bacteriovorax sp.]|nr:hypothetical protein [Bacteriovorax sp.]